MEATGLLQGMEGTSASPAREEDLADQIREKFTGDEIEEYRNFFAVFDLNGDGEISASELGKVSKNMGYKMSKKQLKDIMRATDLDENGTISFEEFLLAMPGNVTHIDVDEHKVAVIRRKFLEYDLSHSGMVETEEAHGILRRELKFSPQQSYKMMDKFKRLGDDYMQYEEFLTFYKHVRCKAASICELLIEYDRHHSNPLSAEEGQALLQGMHLSESQVEGLLAIHYHHAKKHDKQYEKLVSFLLHS